jgi:hypothetical protein
MPSNKKRAKAKPGSEFPTGSFVANVVILFVMGVFLYDIFMQTEHWPFSSHRMYSTIQGPEYVKEVVTMVTSEGEVPLEADKHLYPFGKSRVSYGLRYLTRISDRQVILQAIQNLAKIYELNEQRKGEVWPQMLGLRVYRNYWVLRPDLGNLNSPQKTLAIDFRLP